MSEVNADEFGRVVRNPLVREALYGVFIVATVVMTAVNAALAVLGLGAHPVAAVANAVLVAVAPFFGALARVNTDSSGYRARRARENGDGE
ncbi:hypothetical protein [Leucobacter sp. OH1287]|uniref:hypothetical protein n=1 Tax=Leucobacter sp. OH1287 TaxID=2491049 RepID=UPI000F5EA8AB|nr:hypothetical protein [Leucobacter sp. OH1287]RRD61618.1 hypothetical protein EII30_01980 [Leucobacter sp. OH1287]